MSDRKKLLIGGGVFALSVLFIISQVVDGGAGAKPKVMALGEFAANALADSVQDGQTVLVISRDGDRPSHRAYVQAFQDELANQRQVTFVESRIPEPTDTETSFGQTLVISDQQFASLVSPHSSVDVVVSFVGLPKFGRSMAALWKSKKPFFCVVGVRHENIIDSGVRKWIDLAVVLRKKRSPAASADPADIIAARYELIRP